MTNLYQNEVNINVRLPIYIVKNIFNISFEYINRSK